MRWRVRCSERVRRFPHPGVVGVEAGIEVRQLFELEDFEEGPWIERAGALNARERAP
jgi:hypothetical protein